MGGIAADTRSWKVIMLSWLNPRVITMLFLGLSAGLPIVLIFGTLSIWLAEAGVNRGAVTFFSWAALGYSFKFVWAPLVDKIPFPYLSKRLGRRRSWLLLSQFSIISAIVLMALINPAGEGTSLTMLALAAVLLGFSSATQDIVIDAFRIECIDETFQALLASVYIAGYRIGMIIGSAGALFLAEFLGSTKSHYVYEAWRTTYCSMALVMLAGVITTLVAREPEISQGDEIYTHSREEYIRLFLSFLISCLFFCLFFFFSSDIVLYLKNSTKDLLGINAHLVGFSIECSRLGLAALLAYWVFRFLIQMGFVGRKVVRECYVDPIAEFFERYHVKTALLLLLLIGFYRLSDIVLGVIANVFYVDMGYSKIAIAGISKTYGLGMTILGGLLGGILTLRYGVYRVLFLGALLSAASNLLFMYLSGLGNDVLMLTLVIAVDNLSAGLAAAAFIAFLSSLTSISFTASQYAIFSSLMTLIPKLIGGYSGTIVNNIGYSSFFLLTAVMGIPVLLLVWLARNIEGRTKSGGESG